MAGKFPEGKFPDTRVPIRISLESRHSESTSDQFFRVSKRGDAQDHGERVHIPPWTFPLGSLMSVERAMSTATAVMIDRE